MKKGKKIALATIVAIAVPVIIIYGNSYSSMAKMDNLDYNFIDETVCDDLTLSEIQKISDCNYMLDTAMSVPTSDIQAEMLGFDLSDKREIYIDAVRNSKSDFEFYCIMSGILNDFLSCHTSVWQQDYSKFDEAAYCASFTFSEEGHAQKVNYWKNICNEQMNLSKDMDFLYFNYTEGKYLKSLYYSSDEYSDLTELISVDGVDIDDYIKQAIMGKKIKYDFIDKKAYRSGIAFTSSPYGKQSVIEYKNNKGEIKSCSLYTGVAVDIIFDYYAAYVNPIESVRTMNVYSFCNADKTLGYINLSSMSDTKEFSENFNNISDCKSIILDLRNNSGGYQIFAANTVFSNLFEKDIHYSNKFYIEDTKRNKKIYKPIFNMILSPIYSADFRQLDHTPYFNAEKNKYHYVSEEFDITGNSNIDKDVYLLISSSTLSAADFFTGLTKDNSLATIIGENTGGEGKVGTYCHDKLPESGIVFSYMPARACNNDGTENGLYGTFPDIYSRLSADDYYVKENMLCLGIDPYTYENRLEWDSTLNTTLEIIKEKENIK